MLLKDYIIDMELLEQMISKGYVSVQHEETLNRYIYNYTQGCTFDHMWNSVTEKCRGLIVDGNNDIIARPFVKFYNYEEIEDKSVVPNSLSYRVFDKKDGSLGILWWDDYCMPHIATRGSFSSEQAMWASKFFDREITFAPDRVALDYLRNYLLDYTIDNNGLYHLKRVKKTLLFEIVYPEDRHIVDYGNEESLTLLAIIDNETGKEDEPETLSDYFTVIKSYDGIKDWEKIRDLFSGDNAEGFVVRFSNGFRVKLKFASWFEQNRLLNGLSTRRILDYIMEGRLDNLAAMVAKLNEENRIYFKKLVCDFYSQYAQIEFSALMDYRDDFETDKEAAECFLKSPYSHILFNKRKGKDYSNIIWKIIKKQTKNKTFVEEDA